MIEDDGKPNPLFYGTKHERCQDCGTWIAKGRAYDDRLYRADCPMGCDDEPQDAA